MALETFADNPQTWVVTGINLLSLMGLIGTQRGRKFLGALIYLTSNYTTIIEIIELHKKGGYPSDGDSGITETVNRAKKSPLGWMRKR